MRIVRPIEVTDAELNSTNVVNEYADWDIGSAPYAAGQKAVDGNEVYESISSNSDQPSIGAAADPPTWLRLGWSNQYRMFRDGRDSESSRVGGIDVELEFGQVITTVAALGLQGSEVTLTATDPTDGLVYDETIRLVDVGVSDWWEYFFLPYESEDTALFEGVPPYPSAVYNLSISVESPSDEALAGRIIAGAERELGVSNYGTSVSIIDYSTKERDGFGNIVLVPRRTVRLVDYDVTVSSPRIDFVVRQLEQIASMPTLFIGDALYDSTITFGIYRDFSQGITSPSTSDLTIQVEGF